MMLVLFQILVRLSMKVQVKGLEKIDELVGAIKCLRNFCNLKDLTIKMTADGLILSVKSRTRLVDYWKLYINKQ